MIGKKPYFFVDTAHYCVPILHRLSMEGFQIHMNFRYRAFERPSQRRSIGHAGAVQIIPAVQGGWPVPHCGTVFLAVLS